MVATGLSSYLYASTRGISCCASTLAITGVNKLRAAYRVKRQQIIDTRSLPTLWQVFGLQAPFGAVIFVFGSYCWQYLTQKNYVTATSDVDLLVLYEQQTMAELKRLYQSLQQELGRVDIEVALPGLGDCALLELVNPETHSVLFKTAQNKPLITREEINAAIPTLLC